MKRIDIRLDTETPFNEHKRALTHRAGSAGVAVAVDTRPREIPDRKGRRAYNRRRLRDASNEGA